MIITLAGHVDHGKTSLVKALTGVDTDRLAQEKARGLTIDLGFAYLDNGSIGFVDVPGHQKFIHNMVAGVAQQQYAMLAIAADDGPMPQSREHLDILKLVGVKSGCIALTKCDLVDPARQQAAEEEIRQLTANTFLDAAPIFKTSTSAPESISTLLQHLRDQNSQTITGAEQAEEFRIAVDRAFVVKGIGVVVTGTVHSGSIKVEDTLQLFPANKEVRVRSIRTQDMPAEIAQTGERCALNLSGIELDEVRRGDWLTRYPTPHFKEFSVQLEVLDHFPRPVKHWTPVHIYHATSHTTGKIALLEPGRLAPGSSAVVDLVCDGPLAARYGDQLVIRDFGLDTTLGGGKVIYAVTIPTNRRRSPIRRAEIEAYADPDEASALRRLSQLSPVHMPKFVDARHLMPGALDTLANPDAYVRVDDWIVQNAQWSDYKQTCLQVVKDAARDTTSTGVKENVFTHAPAYLRPRLLNELVAEKKLERAGGLYRLPNQAADLTPQLAKLWERAQADLKNQQAPSTGDLSKQWNIPQHIIDTGFKELVKRGFLIHVAKNRFYLPEQLQAIAQLIVDKWATTAFSVKEFRDTTGIGRNVAIEILEYLDGRGFTRRRDNERIVLKEQL
ncbi:MAG: selenocysteine-specific translation elongation factor [Pseudomonadota bacterium]